MGYRMTIEAMDLSGQNVIRLRRFPAEQTVGELVSTAVSKMGLLQSDPDGRPYTYQARHEANGQALFVSEIVGDVLKSGDRVRLTPNIDAG